MGKSNRIRVNRANERVQTIGVKKKKEMPSWVVSLIAIVLTVAILAGVAVSLMSANGVFNRMTTTVSSEHYTVNANMMSYYFKLQYENFYSNYGSYLSSMLDTSKSLKEQNYSEATDTTEAVTWFDYFMNQTVESVKSMLIYCEEARAQGWDELSDEEKAEIDANIDTLKEQATASGYTLNSYIAAVYGEGVKASDIRKAMKYSAIATKCMNKLSEDLNNAITEDMINERYGNNQKDFNVVDYSYYTFDVSYDDVAKEILGKDSYTADEEAAKKTEIEAAYKAKIQDAKDKAAKLATDAGKDADTFKRLVLGYVAQEAFETVYGEQTVADADKPTDDNLNTIKTAMLAAIVTEVMEGKTETADAATKGEGEDAKGTAYEIEITNTYADTLNTVKEEVFADVLASVDTQMIDKGGYTEEDDFSTWASADGRAAGDTTVITAGDGKAEGEITVDQKTSAVSVYFIRTPQYRDPEKTRNVAYILYDSEESAKAAIETLLNTPDMSLEKFEAYADGDTNATAHTHLENYTEGTMSNETFDGWVYGESTGVGMITATPLNIESGVYAVVYYYGEGVERWNVDVRNTILSENYDTKYAAMEGAYTITVKEKALDKIDA
ncbi:MAG: hypothetical protein IJW44_03455 [Clostridia bacterium]|nr:hypothetical protein [Clostridia bacterium]